MEKIKLINRQKIQTQQRVLAIEIHSLFKNYSISSILLQVQLIS
ncbi:unnamed protein product (macronuclear) [Paramecium tetraurelia]|uniref:Uncharacterized protein n=1 Tax=Paramecium tetraurelia TaxID=5888 RepID=A0EA30_PARTE|nr:uncharacterized protein GSPATT00024879001 [Paramecium tetraurelia]CAK92147.1 unnamed protein product [Paramecium tetraurelia]